MLTSKKVLKELKLQKILEEIMPLSADDIIAYFEKNKVSNKDFRTLMIMHYNAMVKRNQERYGN